jgi:glycosyltransferase involved in cell wall biosynthesis
MVIAQLLGRECSMFDRKMAALDRMFLPELITETWTETDKWCNEGGERLSASELASNLRRGNVSLHVYGRALPLEVIRAASQPYVAATAPTASRSLFSKAAPQPAVVLNGEPESVDPTFLETTWSPHERPAKIAGSISREGADRVRELALARLFRFRTDVEWRSFSALPAATQMMELDLWIDPAPDENDRDGYTAEAVSLGMPIVAAKTEINVRRLDGGRAGRLFPPRDANELVHAALNVLFKPETHQPLLEEARASKERFSPQTRAHYLREIYGRL